MNTKFAFPSKKFLEMINFLHSNNLKVLLTLTNSDILIYLNDFAKRITTGEEMKNETSPTHDGS
jgi:hypothetical protein